MSLIFITNHDENIYNITITQTDLQKNLLKYKSKFPEKNVIVTPVYTKVAKTHATMGLPEEELPDPHNYLKKHSGKPSYTVGIRQEDEKFERNRNLEHKAPTPLVKDLIEDFKKHEKEVESHKDFIKNNVQTAKQMKTKEPDHKLVIDRVGTTIHPEGQGLEPVYIKKTIYGKTPMYLVRFNKIKEKEYQMKKDASGKQQPKCRYITRDEREQLLNGLKKNWKELQNQYQGLPILTDTIKKSKLEADLKEIEKDIVLIKRHPYIYVYDNAEISQ